MANRRMVHKSISVSKQINLLTEFQQLLFTWMIPHLDDFGRIDGDPQTIKAIVMPLSERSLNEFEEAIIKMTKLKLIERYEADEISVIHYINFDKYQSGLEKRTKSRYPDKGIASDSEKFEEVQRNSDTTEPKRTQHNLISPKTTEPKDNVSDSSKDVGLIVNPKDFSPSSDAETAAHEIWDEFEHYNPLAFNTTYLWAVRKGVPADKIYQFASDIRQDENVKNKGAVFQKKVKDYLGKKSAL